MCTEKNAAGEIIKKSGKEMKIDQDKLIKEARTVREKAYAPYSYFKVGAALLSDTGKIYTGCNVENISYGLTVCAERNAVANAIASGQSQFLAIAIVADTDAVTPPCGACRQVLAEFSSNIEIILGNLNGDVKQMLLSDLFPSPFKKNLSGL